MRGRWRRWPTPAPCAQLQQRWRRRHRAPGVVRSGGSDLLAQPLREAAGANEAGLGRVCRLFVERESLPRQRARLRWAGLVSSMPRPAPCEPWTAAHRPGVRTFAASRARIAFATSGLGSGELGAGPAGGGASSELAGRATDAGVAAPRQIGIGLAAPRRGHATALGPGPVHKQCIGFSPLGLALVRLALVDTSNNAMRCPR